MRNLQFLTIRDFITVYIEYIESCFIFLTATTRLVPPPDVSSNNGD